VAKSWFWVFRGYRELIFSAAIAELRSRPLVNAALLGAAYFLTAHFSLELSRLTGDVASMWPPNGIVLAALLVSPTTSWTRYAVATFAAVVAVNLLHGDSVAAGLGFALANLVECLLAAAILRNRGVGSRILASVRNVLLFVLATMLAVRPTSRGRLSRCAAGPWPSG
jgi:integral membrane sensor domain MASE1